MVMYPINPLQKAGLTSPPPLLFFGPGLLFWPFFPPPDSLCSPPLFFPYVSVIESLRPCNGFPAPQFVSSFPSPPSLSLWMFRGARDHPPCLFPFFPLGFFTPFLSRFEQGAPFFTFLEQHIGSPQNKYPTFTMLVVLPVPPTSPLPGQESSPVPCFPSLTFAPF